MKASDGVKTRAGAARAALGELKTLRFGRERGPRAVEDTLMAAEDARLMHRPWTRCFASCGAAATLARSKCRGREGPPRNCTAEQEKHVQNMALFRQVQLSVPMAMLQQRNAARPVVAAARSSRQLSMAALPSAALPSDGTESSTLTNNQNLQMKPVQKTSNHALVDYG